MWRLCCRFLWMFLSPPVNDRKHISTANSVSGFPFSSLMSSELEQKLLTFLPVKDKWGREDRGWKGGGGGGIWIGQWSECKKESGGKRRRTGDRADKDPTSLCSVLSDQKCSFTDFLSIKTSFFYQPLIPHGFPFSFFSFFTSSTLCHMLALTLSPVSLFYSL